MAVRKCRVTVSWRGVAETEAKFRQMPEVVRKGVLTGLSAIALVMQNRARSGIQKGPKSGRVYHRRSVRHQASAPGEFPATDTGTLVASVIGTVEEETLESVLSAGTVYARWLEFGTRLMSPRPFLVPTLKSIAETAVQILRKTVSEALKNAR